MRRKFWLIALIGICLLLLLFQRTVLIIEGYQNEARVKRGLAEFGLQFHLYMTSVPEWQPVENVLIRDEFIDKLGDNGVDWLASIENDCEILWKSMPASWSARIPGGRGDIIALQKGSRDLGGFVLFLTGEVARLDGQEIRDRLGNPRLETVSANIPSGSEIESDPDAASGKITIASLIAKANAEAAAEAKRRIQAGLPELDSRARFIPGSDLGADAANFRYVGMTQDGHWLITELGDGQVRVWDLTRNNPLAESYDLQLPADYRLSFGAYDAQKYAAGLLVAIKSDDSGPLLTWEIEGDPSSWARSELSGHNAQVLVADWTTDGRRIISGDAEGVVREYTFPPEADTPDGRILGRLEVPVRSCRIVEQYDAIIVGNAPSLENDSRISVWKLTGRESERTNQRLPGSWHFRVHASENRRWLGTTGFDGNAAVWDLSHDDIIGTQRRFEAGNFWENMYIGDSGLVVGECRCFGTEVLLPPEDGSGEESVTLQTHGHVGESGSFQPQIVMSPSGRLLATQASPKTISIWRVSTPEAEGAAEITEAVILSDHQTVVRGICFSLDDRLMASVDMDGIVKIWNTSQFGEADIAPIFSGVAEAAAFSNVIFSPDGKWLIAGNWPVISLPFGKPGYLAPTPRIWVWRLNTEGSPVSY